ASLLWRPWIISAKDTERQKRRQQTSPYSPPVINSSSSEMDKSPPLFRHPVRLLWPKSKSYDYLYNEGEKLLENFPVQATINFYDDSDSEEEEEEDYGEDEPEGSEKECSEGEAVSPRTHTRSAHHYTCLN
uniref:Ripply transcriptional repressor 1 n=1 Tax=Latimeria chalumnae TaxID=7897 RepID=H3AZY0_LATCH